MRVINKPLRQFSAKHRCGCHFGEVLMPDIHIDVSADDCPEEVDISVTSCDLSDTCLTIGGLQIVINDRQGHRLYHLLGEWFCTPTQAEAHAMFDQLGAEHKKKRKRKKAGR